MVVAPLLIAAALGVNDEAPLDLWEERPRGIDLSVAGGATYHNLFGRNLLGGRLKVAVGSVVGEEREDRIAFTAEVTGLGLEGELGTLLASVGGQYESLVGPFSFGLNLRVGNLTIWRVSEPGSLGTLTVGSDFLFSYELYRKARRHALFVQAEVSATLVPTTSQDRIDGATALMGITLSLGYRY